MSQNYSNLLTEEGKEFIEELSTALKNRDSIEPIVEEHGITEFQGGSGGREILPLPDSLVKDDSLGEPDSESYFVVKVSGEPLSHNYREIKVWEKACELGWEHESLFAPVHAWDEEEYKWLIMRRVTPISPHRDDIAYLLSGQEFLYDPDAPAQLEERLNELGWTVEDVEMNVGVLDDGVCMMDYGGVDRNNNSIDIPDWMGSEN
ncbi:hypothetical protein [Halobaculum limi]|uniref:hypothetical protein n=1 Tax=Halobaculum limi TaxID=3031916 RepID=UPI00240563C9|nr:hypothetical protein [Halobaculum sp. YSMS11]